MTIDGGWPHQRLRLREWCDDAGRSNEDNRPCVAFMKTTQVPLLAGKTRSQTATSTGRARGMDQSTEPEEWIKALSHITARRVLVMALGILEHYRLMVANSLGSRLSCEWARDNMKRRLRTHAALTNKNESASGGKKMRGRRLYNFCPENS